MKSKRLAVAHCLPFLRMAHEYLYAYVSSDVWRNVPRWTFGRKSKKNNSDWDQDFFQDSDFLPRKNKCFLCASLGGLPLPLFSCKLHHSDTRKACHQNVSSAYAWKKKFYQRISRNRCKTHVLSSNLSSKFFGHWSHLCCPECNRSMCFLKHPLIIFFLQNLHFIRGSPTCMELMCILSFVTRLLQIGHSTFKWVKRCWRKLFRPYPTKGQNSQENWVYFKCIKTCSCMWVFKTNVSGQRSQYISFGCLWNRDIWTRVQWRFGRILPHMSHSKFPLKLFAIDSFTNFKGP